MCASSSPPPKLRARRYDAGRFSFNVSKGRCETCAGEGFVCVELLFLPSVYAPCPTCHGKRFNAKKLEILYRGKKVADVLALTVDDAVEFFAEDAQVSRALLVLQEVGLGYLRLMKQLDGLVAAGNTMIVVEHDMHVVAASDWVIDIGPGAGEDGGRVVVADPPDEIARSGFCKMSRYLAARLDR
jgi:excinuclease ABC subunit A